MKTNFNTIEVTISAERATIALNRPEFSNAFDLQMIREITEAVINLNGYSQVRFILIRGNGKMFCSGADLNWLGNSSGSTYQQNFEESEELAHCFYTLYTSEKITICAIHGAVYAGGNGLAAACDFAFATENTKFGFSEVKIGLVPATIAPYIINKIGKNKASDLLLTGRIFTANEALIYGLIQKIVPDEGDLEITAGEFISLLKKGAPEAQKKIKRMIRELSELGIDSDIQKYTAEILAKARGSEEGKEGINAFLQKRDPYWLKD